MDVVEVEGEDVEMAEAVRLGVLLKRKQFPFNFKMKVVQSSDAMGYKQAALKYGVAERTVRSWISEGGRALIASTIANGFGRAERSRGLAKYADLFAKAYDMYVEMREMMAAVAPLTIREFCIANSDSFGRASTSSQKKALRRFRVHYNLSARRVTGTTQLLPQDSEARRIRYHSILAEAILRLKPTNLCVGDETSVLWHAASKTSLAEKGEKHVKVKTGDEKKCSTAWLFALADLEYSRDEDGAEQVALTNCAHGQPLVIFKGQPGKQVEKNAQAEAREKKLDVRAVATANGWMNEDVFLSFVNKTLPRVANGWFIIDLYRAHRTTKVLDAIKEKGWIPFFIPGGCTSILQVHDLVVNKPFKQHIQQAYAALCFQRKNFLNIQRADVMKFVVDALAAVPINIIAASMRKVIIDPTIAEMKRVVAARAANGDQEEGKQEEGKQRAEEEELDDARDLGPAFNGFEAALDEALAKEQEEQDAEGVQKGNDSNDSDVEEDEEDEEDDEDQDGDEDE